MTFEVIKTTTHDNGEYAFVKLSRPHLCRKVGTNEYLETEYATFSTREIPFDQNEWYYETGIWAAEEDGKSIPAALYVSTVKLSLDEAMFIIGELETPDEPEYAGINS